MTVVTLKLEAINDDVVHSYRVWRRTGGDMPWRLRQTLEDIGCYDRLSETYRCPPSPWVAALTLAPNGSVRRDFLDGHRDYSEADGTGRDGVFMYFHLRPGFVYEVGDVKANRRTRRLNIRAEQERYFAIVKDGRVHRVSKEDAFQMLAAGVCLS